MTIYRINKPTKDIVWRLGGKQTNFFIASGAEFSWQHDARFLPNNLVSMFDDNSDDSSVAGPPSHGLILQLDLQSMTAALNRSYYHDPNIIVASQGNLQSLQNGNKFVGFGQSQYYSEYQEPGNTESNPALNLLYEAEMPGSNYSYRAYRNMFVGRPFYPPSIAIRSNNGQITVYASWNGSTETTSWELFSGCSKETLCLVGSVAKTGLKPVSLQVKKALISKLKA